MTFFKIEAGRYMFGQTCIVKHKPIPGRRQTTVWRDAITGDWLGYTLAEAKETVKRRAARYAQRCEQAEKGLLPRITQLNSEET